MNSLSRITLKSNQKNLINFFIQKTLKKTSKKNYHRNNQKKARRDKKDTLWKINENPESSKDSGPVDAKNFLTRIYYILAVSVVGIVVVGIWYYMMRKKYSVRVPFPGIERKQFIRMSNKEKLNIQSDMFVERIKDGFLEKKDKKTKRLEVVGGKLVKANREYLKVKKFKFFVLAGEEVNCFVLPNGYIVATEGLMDFTKGNDSYLATFVGHELGHVVARHHEERDSMKFTTTDTNHSQTLELEADHIGLVLMSRACYLPHEGVTFWKKFASNFEESTLRERDRTHPPHADRFSYLNEIAYPTALQAYNDSNCPGWDAWRDDFRNEEN